MLGDYTLTCLLHFALWGYFVLEVLAARAAVCRTPGCVQAAEIFKKNMDPSVDPCDNFYNFACGNYVKTEKIPKDKDLVSTFTDAKDNLTKQVRSLLDNPPDHLNDPRPFKMVRNLNYICLRKDLIEERGVGFLVDMLKSAGGWPVLEGDKWDADKFDWVTIVYRLRDLGLNGELFQMSIHVDFVNRLKYSLLIDQVSFGLEREDLIKGRHNVEVEVYRSYITDIAHLFGAKPDAAVKEMGDVLDFEIELANIALSKAERSDIRNLYNPMQIPLLQARYPIVNWDEYILYLMSNISRFNFDEAVNVVAPTYFDKLQVLMKKTDNRTLANYLIWRAVSGAVLLLNSAIRDRHLFYFNQFLTTKKEYDPRWKECLSITADSLTLAVGAMYARSFFKKDAKVNAVEMVENIHGEMMNSLKRSDWMDIETRSKAIDKALVMRKHIGYPNEFMDDKEIEKFYEKLELTGLEFFESIQNLTKFGWNYSAGKFKETINQTDWRSHGNAASTFGYYNPLENSLQFPAGIFQHVLFSHDRPKYMNYGAIGSLIGHEITHGFDFMGQQYDKFGNPELWWYPKTKVAFFDKMQCIIKQANNYTVKSASMNVKGIRVQEEIAASTGGLKLSYKAYNAWRTKHPREPKLIGLEKYTQKQLFWLSAANVWCTKYQDQALRLQVETGNRPPAEYRVFAAMRNQEAFVKDFKCPVGSNMNPVKKCNIW